MVVPRSGAGSQGDRCPLASSVPGAARESASRISPARPLSPGGPDRRAALSGVGGVEGRTSHSHGALPAMPGPHQKHQVSECIHYRNGRGRFEAG